MHPKRALLCLLLSSTPVAAVDFRGQIMPILNSKCAECHSVAKDKVKGKFAVDRDEDIQKHVKAGEPMKSSLVVSVTLPDDDEDVMPPKGKNRLTPAEVTLLKAWIQEGASLAAGGTPPAAAPSPAPAAAGTEILTWTNAEGKPLQAAFGGMQGENVLLKTADGATHAYPLSKLSADSQAQARKLAGQ